MEQGPHPKRLAGAVDVPTPAGSDEGAMMTVFGTSELVQHITLFIGDPTAFVHTCKSIYINTMGTKLPAYYVSERLFRHSAPSPCVDARIAVHKIIRDLMHCVYQTRGDDRERRKALVEAYPGIYGPDDQTHRGAFVVPFDRTTWDELYDVEAIKRVGLERVVMTVCPCTDREVQLWNVAIGALECRELEFYAPDMTGVPDRVLTDMDWSCVSAQSISLSVEQCEWFGRTLSEWFSMWLYCSDPPAPVRVRCRAAHSAHGVIGMLLNSLLDYSNGMEEDVPARLTVHLDVCGDPRSPSVGVQSTRPGVANILKLGVYYALCALVVPSRKNLVVATLNLSDYCPYALEEKIAHSVNASDGTPLATVETLVLYNILGSAANQQWYRHRMAQPRPRYTTHATMWLYDVMTCTPGLQTLDISTPGVTTAQARLDYKDLYAECARRGISIVTDSLEPGGHQASALDVPDVVCALLESRGIGRGVGSHINTKP